MPDLNRLYLFAGLALVIIMALMSGLFVRGQIENRMEQTTVEANVMAQRLFEATLWRRYEDILRQGYVSREFKRNMEIFVKATEAEALRVYSRNGLLLHTTGGTLTATQFKKNRQRVEAHGGYIFSELVDSDEMGQSFAQLTGRTLLRSMIAIGGDNPQAYFVIYRDITDEMESLLTVQLMMGAPLVVLFIILFLYQSYTSRQSEAIIASQHDRTVELEAIATSAQEETKQKTQFLANISHELRTPLNAIIGFSDILRNEMANEMENPKFRSYINDINNSGVHLLALINDILDFSKAEAGKLELDIEEINATKLAITCLRLVAPRAEDAKVELESEMPKEHIVVETDGKKFKQVMLNLLSNAVKFTPEGGKVQIKAWIDLATDSYMFQVKDSGIGIQQKDIAKALSAFGQVDNQLSRKYEGTGLGLPLTRKFVELMGGTFRMHSDNGQGTTVVFSLPRKFQPNEEVKFKRVNK